jgi:hypothetical protein
MYVSLSSLTVSLTVSLERLTYFDQPQLDAQQQRYQLAGQLDAVQSPSCVQHVEQIPLRHFPGNRLRLTPH